MKWKQIRHHNVLAHLCCCCYKVVSNSCNSMGYIALQDPLSMGFLRQEYWSGLPFPLPGGLPDPKIKPTLLMSLALTGRFFNNSTTLEVHRTSWLLQILAIMKEASIKIHLQIFVFMFSTYLNEYQGLNLCLLHWQVGSLPPNHQGNH